MTPSRAFHVAAALWVALTGLLTLLGLRWVAAWAVDPDNPGPADSLATLGALALSFAADEVSPPSSAADKRAS